MSGNVAVGRIDTLILDMDGVVTTEEKYWACARLTLWELVCETFGQADVFPDAVHSAEAREILASDELINALKGRAVNSNWDITYILACIYMAALLESAELLNPPSINTTADLYALISAHGSGRIVWPSVLIAFIEQTAPASGHDLIRAAGNQLTRILNSIGITVLTDGLLVPDGELWWDLHARFQRWYSGQSMREHDAPLLIDGTVLPPEQLHQTLATLHAQGYTLGVATGRPRNELDDALQTFDLLRYFDPARIVTLDIIRKAESALNVAGLSKPHPYSLLKALHPDLSEAQFLRPDCWAQARPTVAMIGDSTGDVQMARASGCHAIGVLTGVRGASAQAIRREILIRHGAEVMLDDLTALPAYLHALEKV